MEMTVWWWGDRIIVTTSIQIVSCVIWDKPDECSYLCPAPPPRPWLPPQSSLRSIRTRHVFVSICLGWGYVVFTNRGLMLKKESRPLLDPLVLFWRPSLVFFGTNSTSMPLWSCLATTTGATILDDVGAPLLFKHSCPLAIRTITRTNSDRSSWSSFLVVL